MMRRLYFDWNATAPLRPQALEAWRETSAKFGNPSSVHAEGRLARAAIEGAREQVAMLVGAAPADVIFTSGGTEANVLALSPAIEAPDGKGPRDRLLLSAIEHPSVRAGGRFPREAVAEIAVDAAGGLDLAALAALLATSVRPLVSVMAANNETGVIQPVAEAASMVHRAGGLLHVDAVQALGRIPFDINTLGADLVSLSAHKIGGPKGVGALLRASDGFHFPDPLMRGGGQERGLRAGTENVAGIVAFAAAAAAVRETWQAEVATMTRLRDRLEAGLRDATPDVAIFGSAAPRLPNTTLFSLPGTRAETAVMAFDLAGIAVSSGSACSSGKVQPSHVLAAMAVEPGLARGAVRVSIGWDTSEADVDGFLSAWRKLASALSRDSKVRPGFAA
jgi:cysteine desulfurase